MTFVRTTAINKILSLKKFIRGVQGGTSAGKTFGILPIIIDYCAKNPLTECSIVAESMPHIKRGALRDFKKIMIETGRWRDDGFNKTDSVYTFANGSFCEFFSADDDAKLRGARRDILYMNECNNMTFHAFTELSARTKKFVYLDWNPTNTFWFHEELLGDSDVDFLVINYLDNEACPESALNFILKAKEKSKISSFWENWYRVYGLGEIGSLEGVVFNNWTQIDQVPAEAKYIARGLDFGFTNDPTALVGVYQYNSEIILDEELYQTGLLNSDIQRLLKVANVGKNLIIADSSEPKSIEEISRGGFNIKGAIKGKDSVMFGIDYMQQFRLRVTKRSVNLIKEFRNYTWDKDKSGKVLNTPIDAFNHGIDACRYAVSDLSKPKFDLGAY